MAMLELDAGAVRRLGDEAAPRHSLTFSGSVSICQVGPMFQVSSDPLRRLVGEDARPPALAAVGAAVVEVAAGERLEDQSRRSATFKQVVLGRLERAEVAR